MDVDVNAILTIALVASIIGHLVSGYWSFSLMKMMLNKLGAMMSPPERPIRRERLTFPREEHPSNPMPPVNHYTTPLGDNH
jgi:hypothetical protein